MSGLPQAQKREDELSDYGTFDDLFGEDKAEGASLYADGLKGGQVNSVEVEGTMAIELPEQSERHTQEQSIVTTPDLAEPREGVKTPTAAPQLPTLPPSDLYGAPLVDFDSALSTLPSNGLPPLLPQDFDNADGRHSRISYYKDDEDSRHRFAERNSLSLVGDRGHSDASSGGPRSPSQISPTFPTDQTAPKTESTDSTPKNKSEIRRLGMIPAFVLEPDEPDIDYHYEKFRSARLDVKHLPKSIKVHDEQRAGTAALQYLPVGSLIRPRDRKRSLFGASMLTLLDLEKDGPKIGSTTSESSSDNVAEVAKSNTPDGSPPEQVSADDFGSDDKPSSFNNQTEGTPPSPKDAARFSWGSSLERLERREAASRQAWKEKRKADRETKKTESEDQARTNAAYKGEGGKAISELNPGRRLGAHLFNDYKKTENDEGSECRIGEEKKLTPWQQEAAKGIKKVLLDHRDGGNAERAKELLELYTHRKLNTPTEISALVQAFQERSRTLKEVQAAAAQANQSAEIAQRRLIERDALVRNLEAELEKQKGRVARREEWGNEQEEEAKQANEKASRCEQELRRSSVELERLEKKINDLRSTSASKEMTETENGMLCELTELRGKVLNLELELIESKKVTAEQQRQASEHERNRDTLTKQLQQTTEELESATRGSNPDMECEKKLDLLRKQLDAALLELCDEQEKNIKLKGEIESTAIVADEKDKFDAEFLNMVGETYRQFEHKVASGMNQLKMLGKSRKEARFQIKENEAALSLANEQLSKRNKRIEGFEQRIEELDKAYLQRFEELDHTNLNALHAKIDRPGEEVDQIEDLFENFQELETLCEDRRLELNNLRAELDTMKFAAKTHTDELLSSEKDKSAFRQTIKGLREELERYNSHGADGRSLVSRIAELTADKEILEKESTDRRMEAQQLLERVRDYERQHRNDPTPFVLFPPRSRGPRPKKPRYEYEVEIKKCEKMTQERRQKLVKGQNTAKTFEMQWRKAREDHLILVNKDLMNSWREWKDRTPKQRYLATWPEENAVLV